MPAHPKVISVQAQEDVNDSSPAEDSMTASAEEPSLTASASPHSTEGHSMNSTVVNGLASDHAAVSPTSADSAPGRRNSIIPKKNSHNLRQTCLLSQNALCSAQCMPFMYAD